jgi:thymidylate kinase
LPSSGAQERTNPKRGQGRGARRGPKFSQGQIPPLLLQLFDDLDEDGLGWCLLRPSEGLCATTGDIDILARPIEFHRIRQILKRADFVNMRTEEEDLHYAGFDRKSGRFPWVHVQPSLKVGGAVISADILLRSARRTRFPEIASEWLLWTLLIRGIERQYLPEHYRKRVVELASEWNGGPPELVEIVKKHGLEPQRIVALAAAADWEALVAQPWPGRGESRAAPWLSLAHQAKRIMLGLLQPKRRGLCVAIIGPDGAGKSTLIQGLGTTLPLRTRTMYMGLTGGRMKRAASLRVPGVVLSAKIALLWAKFCRALLYRAAGRIVLFDRYPFDGAVPPGRPMDILSRFSRRVQRWALPAPDLVLLLDASGRTMYARKGEYAAETLEAWRSQYRRLQERLPNLVLLDAEKGAAEVLQSAQAIIWEKLRKRRTA